MKIYFHGATGDVSGSAYHVKTNAPSDALRRRAIRPKSNSRFILSSLV